MAEKDTVQAFDTYGKDVSEEINTYMETEIASGRCFDIKVKSVYSFDKQYNGGTQKWLMLVFVVQYHKDYPK